MQYLGLAVVVGFLALLIVLVALRLLFGGHWLLGWLRGNLGLLFLAAAGLVGLLAYEVSQYHAIPADRTLAEVSFAQQKGRRYEAGSATLVGNTVFCSRAISGSSSFDSCAGRGFAIS